MCPEYSSFCDKMRMFCNSLQESPTGENAEEFRDVPFQYSEMEPGRRRVERLMPMASASS